MEKRKYPIEKRNKWKCPEGGGAPLLTMPNIVKPLQGQGCQPRTILGASVWDRLRKRTYFLAGYKSEISGVDLSKPGMCHAHELFDVDYKQGTATFKRCVCISPEEHIYFIHSGRMVTLYKRRNPLYSAKKVLDGVENGFKLIHDWNKAHPKETKLKAYQTLLELLKQEEIADKVEELIDKYEIEFWGEDTKNMAEWKEWKLIFGKKEYPTPYENCQAWEEAMKIASKNDTVRKASNPFKGGAYDEISAILKNTQ